MAPCEIKQRGRKNYFHNFYQERKTAQKRAFVIPNLLPLQLFRHIVVMSSYNKEENVSFSFPLDFRHIFMSSTNYFLN